MPQSPIWRGSQALVEQPDSPEWVFGDQVTAVRSWKGPFALILASAPGRGALGAVSGALLRVRESRVKREKGAIGYLSVTYESTGDEPPPGATLPPDEVVMEPQRLERALQYHPRYATIISKEFQYVKTLLETPADSYAFNDAFAKIQASARKALLEELWLKLSRDFTHHVLYPPQVRRVQHWWAPPTGLSGGGFRQNPPDVGFVLPAGLDWLREADRVAWNGTTWTVESSWIAGPDLDHDIYPAG